MNNKKSSSPPTSVGTQVQAAEILGVPASLLRKAKRLGSPGFDGHGRVKIALVRSWMENHQAELAAEDAHERLAQARLQKTLEELRKLRIANDFKEGLSMTLASYDQDFANLCAEVSGALNGMPQRLAPDLAGLSIVDAEKILSAWCDEVLKKLAAP